MFQSCESEIDFSIPNQIRLNVISKPDSNPKKEIRISNRMYDEKAHVYQWIVKEIPKLRSGLSLLHNCSGLWYYC
ncbi:hypothetical protein [Leptospira mayottensis]|uniref:Uncharacterized protein n=2 Tax=Leptospira mayottensis TaxID=1137606 RepID=A0AA87MSH4_9LEPT|nr:hypothetical protein [Leptospira mayottensis]AXR62428.1 hypothetical protein DQM68_10500 [Leptospira mayottensis]AXR65695.1 hypothetical protein DQM28_17260 [Leptospira mayottensis]AZQ02513.1 hypothetical protein LEP1GSC190_11190 [Leptospira mayottensis 200901116]EKS00976.1 hypothetical protein LEP1GSC125_3765 [Leptospira mayottensis 200901122]TGM96029.1 hypothetical protein EHR03_16115 [Leptospira mayottensis]